MTKFLLNKFVPSENYNNKESRKRVSILSGVIGIIINLLLFAVKFLIGSLIGLVSVTADAFNNLSDCGSAVVSIVGARLSGKSPDKEHPYGHQRIEYIASLFISFIILFLGVGLLYSSVMKIIEPEVLSIDIITAIILFTSSLLKIWLYYFNKTAGKLISSTILKAVSIDSLSDGIATGAVLISLIISPFIGYDLDGIAGIIVASLILKEGFGIIRESFDHIIGIPPDKEFCDKLLNFVLSYDGIVRVHDLIIHSYGPNRVFASIHAELPRELSFMEAHKITDEIEKEAIKLFDINLIVHMDPAEEESPEIRKLKEQCEMESEKVSEELNLHDFRVVKPEDSEDGIGSIYFEVTKPYSSDLEKDEIKNKIESRIREIAPNYKVDVVVDEIYTQI